MDLTPESLGNPPMIPANPAAAAQLVRTPEASGGAPAPRMAMAAPSAMGPPAYRQAMTPGASGPQQFGFRQPMTGSGMMARPRGF